MVAEVVEGKELTTLHPRRAGVSVRANLKPLLWSLAPHQMPVLCRNLLEDLDPFGIDPGDMRIDNGDGSLEGYNLNFWALDFRAKCEIRLSRVEIECRTVEQTDTRNIDRLMQVILATINRTDSDTTVVTYEISMHVIGAPTDITPRKFLRRFASRNLIGLGPNIGNGASFHFGARGARTFCSISVDISKMFSDSIIVDIRAEFDGTQLQRENLISESIALLTTGLETLDLRLPVAETEAC